MRQRSEKPLTCSDIRNVHRYISFIAYVTAIILFVHPTPAKAQMWDSLATTDYRVDSSMTRTLRVVVDNLSFFRDNEYSSTLTKGYSLPGLWIQPRLAYTPHRQIDLELGLHAAIFQGANKYPNYVYHDIAEWKGSQYQRGAHVLPWIRARAQFQNLTVVLGDIYGGQNHQLMRKGFILPSTADLYAAGGTTTSLGKGIKLLSIVISRVMVQ